MKKIDTDYKNWNMAKLLKPFKRDCVVQAPSVVFRAVLNFLAGLPLRSTTTDISLAKYLNDTVFHCPGKTCTKTNMQSTVK